jgi:hypothetical protein
MYSAHATELDCPTTSPTLFLSLFLTRHSTMSFFKNAGMKLGELKTKAAEATKDTREKITVAAYAGADMADKATKDARDKAWKATEGARDSTMAAYSGFVAG